VTPGDASVTLDIDGLPVQLVLPERDVDLMMWTYRANRILQEGATMSDDLILPPEARLDPRRGETRAQYVFLTCEVAGA